MYGKCNYNCMCETSQYWRRHDAICSFNRRDCLKNYQGQHDKIHAVFLLRYKKGICLREHQMGDRYPSCCHGNQHKMFSFCSPACFSFCLIPIFVFTVLFVLSLSSVTWLFQWQTRFACEYSNSFVYNATGCPHKYLVWGPFSDWKSLSEFELVAEAIRLWQQPTR